MHWHMCLSAKLRLRAREAEPVIVSKIMPGIMAEKNPEAVTNEKRFET